MSAFISVLCLSISISFCVVCMTHDGGVLLVSLYYYRYRCIITILLIVVIHGSVLCGSFFFPYCCDTW